MRVPLFALDLRSVNPVNASRSLSPANNICRFLRCHQGVPCDRIARVSQRFELMLSPFYQIVRIQCDFEKEFIALSGSHSDQLGWRANCDFFSYKDVDALSQD